MSKFVSRTVVAAALSLTVGMGCVACHSTPSKPRVVLEKDELHGFELIEKTPDTLVVEFPMEASFHGDGSGDRNAVQKFADTIAARDGKTATCTKFDEPSAFAGYGAAFGGKPMTTVTFKLTPKK